MLNYQRVLSISPVLSNTIHVILDLDDSYFHVHRPITPCPSPRLAWGSHGTDLPSYPPSECLPKEPTYGDDFFIGNRLGNPHWSFFLNQGKPGDYETCLLMFIVQRPSNYGHFVEVWLSNSNDFANTPCTPGFMADHVLALFFFRSPQLVGWSGSFFWNILHYITLISVTSIRI